MDDVGYSLSVLGKVGPGQKLSFAWGEITIVENPSKIFRWFVGDGKHTTLAGVSRIIHDAIHLDLPIGQDVLTSLENLKLTYHACDKTCFNLDVIKSQIQRYMYDREIKNQSTVVND